MTGNTSFQALFRAARLMDEGSSPRSAARQSGCPRREVLSLQEDAARSGRTARQETAVRYLSHAERVQDGRYGHRTTSEITRALGLNSDNETRQLMQSLQRQGAIVNSAGTPPPPEPRGSRSSQTAIHTMPDLRLTPVLSRAPSEDTSPEQAGISDFAGRRSTVIEFASASFLRIVQECDNPEALPFTNEERTIALITDPDCTLVLLEDADARPALLPPEGAPRPLPGPQLAWPTTGRLYIELARPLPIPNGEPETPILMGFLVMEGPPPRAILALYDDLGTLAVGGLYADLTTGEAHCASDSHDCADETHQEAAETALALAGLLSRRTLQPIPLSRQQKRQAQRRNLPHRWHVPASQPPHKGAAA